MHRVHPFVYLFTMGHFATDCAQGAIPALLPYFISVCDLNYQQAASLIFANISLASVTQPFFGLYADRISKPWFVPAGPVLCGISLAGMGFTTDYWMLCFLSMVCGLGSSVFHPEAALMVNKISVGNKGQAIGSFSVGGNAGFAVGPVAAGFCAYAFDIRGLLVFGVMSVVLAAILYGYMPRILGQARLHDQEEKMAHPERVLQNDWPAFGKLCMIVCSRSVGFKVANAFIPIYWITVLGTDAVTGSAALTILFGLGTVFTFVGGLLADRFGFVRMLRIACTLMVPTLYLLVHSQNIMLATLLLVPAAFSLFAMYSPMVVLGQTYLEKNVGLASGVTMGLGTTLGGVAAPIVGWAADQWGIGFALQILWIAALFGAVFSFLLPRIHR